MLAFFASLRDLCLFRRGPEDMPYSPALLAGLLVVCAVLRTAFDIQNGFGAIAAVAAIFGGLATLWAVFMLLRWREKTERFVQTATSLAAASALFDLLEYPLVPLVPIRQFLEHPGERLALTGGQTLAALAISVFGIWQLCVWIFTLRRSLEVSLAGGVLAFLGLLFVNTIAMGLVAGLVGGA